MGFETYSKCFHTNICPILDYGAEVTGYSKVHKFDNVANKAMRVFLGVHKFAANNVLHGDMGWLPTKIRHKISMLRYWNRLIKMDNDRLTRIIF